MHIKIICAVLCLVMQSNGTVCDPVTVALQAPLSVGILQARILEWVVTVPFSRGTSDPRIEPRSPALQADSLPS